MSVCSVGNLQPDLVRVVSLWSLDGHIISKGDWLKHVLLDNTNAVPAANQHFVFLGQPIRSANG